MRSLRSRALAPAVVLLVLGASASASAGPTATAAATCSIKGQERTFGPTYVTAITASGTSCANAKKVVRAFHACRKVHGVKGRCTRKVLGYSCRETRGGIPTQFSGKVTCVHGHARIVHTYTQFT